MKRRLKVLIVCEVSGVVRKAFEDQGCDAWSNDLNPTRDADNQKHILGDAISAIKSQKWDAVIGFPPCTLLALSGSRLWKAKEKDGRQGAAIKFFMDILSAKAFFTAVENPVGIMSRVFRKPNQIIHPYYFGDPVQKKTCLWTKNLPALQHVKESNLFEERTWVQPVLKYYKSKKTKSGLSAYSPIFANSSTGNESVRELRSNTSTRVAEAMARQWVPYMKTYLNLFD